MAMFLVSSSVSMLTLCSLRASLLIMRIEGPHLNTMLCIFSSSFCANQPDSSEFFDRVFYFLEP